MKITFVVNMAIDLTIKTVAYQHYAAKSNEGYSVDYSLFSALNV